MMRTAALIATVVVAPLLAAQETSGRLHGRVLAGTGVTASQATITLSSPVLPTARLVRPNSQGYFIAYALPPGEYRAHVRSLGHREVIVERIQIALGASTALADIALTRAEVRLEPIIVLHDAMLSDPLSTELASRLDVRLAEQLPLGRDYQSIMLLLPHVQSGQLLNDGLNIAGGTGLENAYYVDGMNVTEGYRNSGGIKLPPSFIDQVEVKVGGYEPEFGRALGGIVSLTTRSGTNNHEASAFSYYTASSLASSTARSNFDFASGRFGRYDVGVAIGGPVVRDRLWYFAAYDAGIATEHVNLPGGTRVDRARSDQFAGKLTWQANSRTALSATVVGDPSRRDMVGHSFWGALPIASLTNADAYLGYWDVGSVATSISANSTVGSHTLLEASASWSTSRDRTGPFTARGATEPLYIDFVTGEWSGGYGNTWDRKSTRATATLAASYETGPHTFKVGVQLEENRQNENWHWIRTSVGGLGAIMRAAPTTYLGLWLDHLTKTRSRIPTLFAQSSLRLHERVRLNPGVRTEGQYFFSATTGRSGSITNQLQPRLGVIVFPAADLQQRVTAAFGRYYQQLSNHPVTWYVGGLHQDALIYDADPRSGATAIDSIYWDYFPLQGMRGQHFDEVTLGYERQLRGSMSLSLRGTRRRMREILAESPDPSDPTRVYLGNPGRAQFASLPTPQSRYDALELSLGRLSSARRSFLLTYVLSKKYGNYIGLFDQDIGNPNPHALGASVSGGLLPNDRTHAFKAIGLWGLSRTLTVGAAGSVQSGTPLTEFGAVAFNPTAVNFLAPRGSSGRTPTLWDVNLRATYNVPANRALREARIVADLLHGFSRKTPLRLNQVKYLSVDGSGNPTDPNPFYGRGIQFQPPMALRLGVEIGVSRAESHR